jgi:hypothetical protein
VSAVALESSAAAQTVAVTAPAPAPTPAGFGKKPIEFSDLGQAISAQEVKTPADAEPVRQMSAPIMRTGQTVLIDIYKLNGDLFAEILTSRNGQPWMHQNHLRLPSPFPLNPEHMEVSLRYLRPPKRTGYLVVASDPAGSVTIALPTGFGGLAKMQEFLATSDSAPAAHVTYAFDDLDSRGYVIVKGSLESSGDVTPTADEQFYVWNGTQFIPRKAN